MLKNGFVAALILAFLMAFTAVANADEWTTSRMRLNIWGNGSTVVGGSFTPALQTSDVVGSGPSFAISWQYNPFHSLGFEIGYQLSWMDFEKEFRTEEGKTPAFVVHQITLAGKYNFGDLISPDARIRPFISAGIGMYPFRFTEDGLGGDTQVLPNGNKFEKTSFGLNTGAGIEIRALNRLSIIGGVRYHYLFAKDDDKFGADSGFKNQGLLNYGIGLSYHLPIH